MSAYYYRTSKGTKVMNKKTTDPEVKALLRLLGPRGGFSYHYRENKSLGD